jgi:predicted transcriptional regulator
VDTRSKVAALLEEGKSRLEAARILGLSKSTVSYHARRLGLPIDDRCNRRYDWEEVQRYYDEGHSIAECHHVNGDGSDNRLENLQLLCGNCHSQTDNWGGKAAVRRNLPPGADQLAA